MCDWTSSLVKHNDSLFGHLAEVCSGSWVTASWKDAVLTVISARYYIHQNVVFLPSIHVKMNFNVIRHRAALILGKIFARGYVAIELRSYFLSLKSNEVTIRIVTLIPRLNYPHFSKTVRLLYIHEQNIETNWFNAFRLSMKKVTTIWLDTFNSWKLKQFVYTFLTVSTLLEQKALNICDHFVVGMRCTTTTKS